MSAHSSQASYAESSPGSTLNEDGSDCGDEFPRPLVVLLFHGDHDVFEHRFMSGGAEGGRQCAEALHQATVNHLAKRGFGDESTYRLMAYYFYNKQGLVPHLLRTGAVVDYAGFDQFIKGFNSSRHAFVGVDAGTQKNATENRVRLYLNIHTEPFSGDVVLIGGLHNPHYAEHLRQLSPQSLAMITLVRTTKLKAVEFDDLPNVQTTRDFQPLFDQRARPTFNFGGGGGPFAGRGGGGQKKLGGGGPKIGGGFMDMASLSHALHACNDFYLRPGGCQRAAAGFACPYSHDFTFTDAEWTELPLRARRTPCKMFKHGGNCLDGNQCIWGHECGYTAQDCPHGRACWFLKAGMKHFGDP
ncbi:hypothetical protein RQP46_001304 [Phenoliferia psychrophenolica]